MEILAYQVYNPAGALVMQADPSCRHSRLQELLLLENGYTIKLNGRKLTKTEIRKEIKQK